MIASIRVIREHEKAVHSPPHTKYPRDQRHR